MVKKKTSEKPKAFSRKKAVKKARMTRARPDVGRPFGRLKPGVKTTPHDPVVRLANREHIAQALIQAIVDQDKEAFIEILRAHVTSLNVLQMEKSGVMSRATAYSAIKDDANPSLETIIKLVHAS